MHKGASQSLRLFELLCSSSERALWHRLSDMTAGTHCPCLHTYLVGYSSILGSRGVRLLCSRQMQSLELSQQEARTREF